MNLCVLEEVLQFLTNVILNWMFLIRRPFL